MLNAVKVEFWKLCLRKKFWVLLSIQIFIVIIVTIASSVGGFSYFGASIDLPIVSYMTLNVIVDFAIPLVAFMMCADIFAGEVENGTLRAALLRPITRVRLFAAKCLSIMLMLFVNLMATWLSVTLTKIILGGGFGGVAPLFVSYVISIVPIAAFVCFGAFLSMAAKHSSLTMFLLLVIYLMAQGITMWRPQIGAMMFTSHLEWYKMFLSGGFRALHINTLLLIGATCGLFGTGAAFIFDNVEL